MSSRDVVRRIHERKKLPPFWRAISDALDEYLARTHGIFTSWSHPVDFLDWLEKRGYTITKLEDSDG